MNSYVNVEPYIQDATDAIIGLLEQELAVVWLELEAKLAEHSHPRAKQGFNPHILSLARQRLLRQGRIIETNGATKAGRIISVLTLASKERISTAVSRKAARKRLLQGRYLSWAETTNRRPNLIGEGGERVTSASLRAAINAGYVMVNPTGGPVKQFWGINIPGGPLDDAAHLLILQNGVPASVAAVPIEVKNIRHWIYPSSDELYQLLSKSSIIQAAYPDRPVIPVLVCRKAHYTTFAMAKDLGFVVYYTGVQPILPHSDIDARLLGQVNAELRYNLVLSNTAHQGLTDAFLSLPNIAERTSIRWKCTTVELSEQFAALRNPSLATKERARRMDELRKNAARLPDHEGGW